MNRIPDLHDIPVPAPSNSAALMVNPQADSGALYFEAEFRLTAAKAMLLTASQAGDAAGAELSGSDVQAIAQAAHILTSDALDLFGASHVEKLKEAARLPGGDK